MQNQRVILRRGVLLAWIALSGLQVGCSGGDGDLLSAKKLTPCLPEEVRAALQNETASAPERDAVAIENISGNIKFYFDASVSMLGFVNGYSNQTNYYQEIVASTVPYAQQPKVEYFLFGGCALSVTTEVKEFGTAFLFRDQLYKSEDYKKFNLKCKETKKNVSQQTRLDLRFREAALAVDPQELHVVLTDLFPSDDIEDHLQKWPLLSPLSEALSKGKGIGILGVKSPFNGKVTDLPSFAAKNKMKASELDMEGVRPFYLVAMGPPARVNAYLEQVVAKNLSGLQDQKDYFYIKFPQETHEAPMASGMNVDLYCQQRRAEKGSPSTEENKSGRDLACREVKRALSIFGDDFNAEKFVIQAKSTAPPALHAKVPTINSEEDQIPAFVPEVQLWQVSPESCRASCKGEQKSSTVQARNGCFIPIEWNKKYPLDSEERLPGEVISFKGAENKGLNNQQIYLGVATLKLTDSAKRGVYAPLNEWSFDPLSYPKIHEKYLESKSRKEAFFLPTMNLTPILSNLAGVSPSSATNASGGKEKKKVFVFEYQGP